MEQKYGMWIALEGTDCVGKTTQISLVQKALQSACRRPVVLIHEFSDSPIGDVIRSVLSEKRFFSLNKNTPFADTLTLCTDLLYRYELNIKPAVTSGSVVISDRGPATIYAYQTAFLQKQLHMSEKEAFTWVDAIQRHLHIRPSMTVLMRISDEERFRRMHLRKERSLKSDELRAIHVMDSLMERASRISGESVRIVDGEGSRETVTERIVDAIGCTFSY